MKITDKTLAILKNFSDINQSLVLKEGNEIKTISPSKTVIAVAIIEEEIPSKAVIYDLKRMLPVLAIFEKPEIEFHDKYFVFSEGRRKTKYQFADESMVIAPPDKDIVIPDPDVVVDIEWKDFQSVIKAAGVLQLPDVAFVGENGKCYLRAIDSTLLVSAKEGREVSSDTFGVELGDTNDTFILVIRTENIKLMPNDYKVTLSSAGISKFEAENIKYFIAIESKHSKYTKG